MSGEMKEFISTLVSAGQDNFVVRAQEQEIKNRCFCRAGDKAGGLKLLLVMRIASAVIIVSLKGKFKIIGRC